MYQQYGVVHGEKNVHHLIQDGFLSRLFASNINTDRYLSSYQKIQERCITTIQNTRTDRTALKNELLEKLRDENLELTFDNRVYQLF